MNVTPLLRKLEVKLTQLKGKHPFPLQSEIKLVHQLYISKKCS